MEFGTELPIDAFESEHEPDSYSDDDTVVLRSGKSFKTPKASNQSQVKSSQKPDRIEVARIGQPNTATSNDQEEEDDVIATSSKVSDDVLTARQRYQGKKVHVYVDDHMISESDEHERIQSEIYKISDRIASNENNNNPRGRPRKEPRKEPSEQEKDAWTEAAERRLQERMQNIDVIAENARLERLAAHRKEIEQDLKIEEKNKKNTSKNRARSSSDSSSDDTEIEEVDDESREPESD